MRRMILESKRPPKKAVQRMFVIGMNTRKSLLSYYSMEWESIVKKKLTGISSLNPSDGYMIIQHLKKFKSYSHKDWKDYLSSSSLLFDALREEIQRDKIILKNPKFYGSYWLIPYNTTDNSMFIQGFHNLGQPYYWEEPNWLKKCSATKKFSNGHDLFYCMLLPGHLQRAGIHIKLSKKNFTNTLKSLDISFFGPMISCLPYMSKDGIALWSNIQLSLLCNNTASRYTLPNVGNNTYKTSKELAQNLFSPLKLKIPVVSSCQINQIQKIELTFTSHHLHFFKKFSTDQQITWEIE